MSSFKYGAVLKRYQNILEIFGQSDILSMFPRGGQPTENTNHTKKNIEQKYKKGYVYENQKKELTRNAMIQNANKAQELR